MPTLAGRHALPAAMRRLADADVGRTKPAGGVFDRLDRQQQVETLSRSVFSRREGNAVVAAMILNVDPPDPAAEGLQWLSDQNVHRSVKQGESER